MVEIAENPISAFDFSFPIQKSFFGKQGKKKSNEIIIKIAKRTRKF